MCADTDENLPDPFPICIKYGRPLWREAEDAIVISSVLIVKIRCVKEVKALQSALYCQTKAGRSASVAWESALSEDDEDDDDEGDEGDDDEGELFNNSFT